MFPPQNLDYFWRGFCSYFCVFEQILIIQSPSKICTKKLRLLSTPRQQLEEVLNKLKGIAKEVNEIIRSSENDQSWKKIEAEEVKMYTYTDALRTNPVDPTLMQHLKIYLSML
nr:uncharacterized protein LOC104087241 [Nicotiana tomentosiformis]